MFSKILKHFKGQQRVEQKKMDKEYKERVDRLMVVMQESLGIIFKDTKLYPLGYESFEKGQEGIKPIVGNLLNLYLAKNIRLDDILFMKNVIAKTLEDIHQTTVDSINHNLSYIDKRVWGVHKDDIDFEKIDEMVKLAIEDEEKEDDWQEEKI